MMKKKSKKNDAKVMEIDIYILLRVIAVLAAVVLSVLCVIKVIKGFMKVSEFEVLGAIPYEREDIINATGVRFGDKLYSVDTDKVEKNILEECAYIKDVSVSAKFPNTLKISLEAYAVTWYIEIEGDYYSLDKDLRVLEETPNGEKFKNGGITRLTLPNVKSAIVGSKLTYGESDAEREFSESFMTMVKQMSFKTRLTLVDIDNRFDINIGVDGVYDVYMGNKNNLEEKLKALETALADKRLENCVSAKIDVSDPSSVYIRPVFDYGNAGTEVPEQSEAEG